MVFAGLAVPPVLEVFFRGPGGDDEVAVFALDREEQLEASQSGPPVDGVCAPGEALLELGPLPSGTWMALIFTTDMVFGQAGSRVIQAWEERLLIDIRLCVRVCGDFKEFHVQEHV